MVSYRVACAALASIVVCLAAASAVAEMPVAPAAIAPDETPQSARSTPFAELSVSKLESGPLLAKWRDLQTRLHADEDIVAQCRAKPQACVSEAAKHLIAIAEGLRGREGRALLGHVNRAVNLAIRPADDLSRFGVADHWSAPLETLASGQGDCEDYAILKYAILRSTGYAAEDLRMLIVRGASAPEDHAVLTVRVEGRWLVLDNRRFAMIDTAHLDATALFYLDGEGVWALRPPEPAPLQAVASGGHAFGVMPALM